MSQNIDNDNKMIEEKDQQQPGQNVKEQQKCQNQQKQVSQEINPFSRKSFKFQRNLSKQKYSIIQKQLHIRNKKPSSQGIHQNPYQTTQLILKINEQFTSLLTYAQQIEEFVNAYLKTKKMERLQKVQQSPQKQLELFITQISLQQHSSQRYAIQLCINKLKVMIAKARFKQTTRAQFTQTYLAKLKQVVDFAGGSTNERKRVNKLKLRMQNEDLVTLGLELIKSQYSIIDIKSLLYRKIIPNNYLNYKYPPKPQLSPQQKVFLFIDFFTQKLLFINNEYINFPQDLLYCPIVSQPQSRILSISSFYLDMVSNQDIQWMKHRLVCEVYHLETSHHRPIFYEELLPNHRLIQMPYYSLPSRFQRNVENLKQLFQLIKNVRKFICTKMIQYWINSITNSHSNDYFQLLVEGKFKVVLKSSYETVEFPEEMDQEQNYEVSKRSELLTDLLHLTMNNQNTQKNKTQLNQQLITVLRLGLFRAIKKTIFKSSLPVKGQSLGKYYYEIGSDKNYYKKEMKHLFNHF